MTQAVPRDRRLTPANGRVAARGLQDSISAPLYVDGTSATVIAPVADLLPAPGKRRDRQMLYGTAVTVFERYEGHAFVQSALDGYVGYVAEAALGTAVTPTHAVGTSATHVYETESLKSTDLMHLSFGSRVTVTAERRYFFETPRGYIPKKHLRPLDRPFADPATVAPLFFGTPYLWGGNSMLGIDCSGLIQAALTACDIACPGDSDLQMVALGETLADGVPPARGDLYFWKGHVGMLVDADTLLHSNGHHMATVYEPIAAAILRIGAQGDGKVLRRARL